MHSSSINIWALTLLVCLFCNCTAKNSFADIEDVNPNPKIEDNDTIPEVDENDVQLHLTIATMGASLMYSENGWVEKACELLELPCLNKAVNGSKPIFYAQQLWLDTYATAEELQQIDILLIQFANCYDVCGDSATLLPNADDYTRNYTSFSSNLFEEYSYAQQIDYILKKWQQLCELSNKPMHVIFVTHWHDARVIYNESIRKLAQRWNADVCELDKNIGFTKDQPLPDDTQPSIQYSVDTEIIDGIRFGWHPLRGEEGNYIQSVMAEILKDKLSEHMSKKYWH